MTPSTNDRPFRKSTLISALVLLAGVLLTVLRHWEMAGESSGYWSFARLIAETGRFTVIDRSIFYVVYLNLFRWMGYPTSVTVEYIVTTFFMAIAFMYFLRPMLGTVAATVASLFWIPFLQGAEPPSQKMALALICGAVAIRVGRTDRFRLALSYALFILAYLCRVTYLLPMLFFVAWDLRRLFVARGWGGVRSLVPRPAKDWPLWVVSVFFLCVVSFQSTDSWNNVLFSKSVEWYPGKGKSLSASAFIQNYNVSYIRRTYVEFKGHDFYFTNREVFGGAETPLGMLKANPRVFGSILQENILSSVPVISSMTYVAKKWVTGPSAFAWAAHLILLLLLLWGALHACKSTEALLFVASSVVMLGTAVLVTPKERYMVPAIPIIVLGGYWWGRKMGERCFKKPVIAGFLGALGVIYFSYDPTFWDGLKKGLRSDFRKGELRALVDHLDSAKATYPELNALAKGCTGILTLEEEYAYAFFDVPRDRIYSVWEFPPFGHFKDAQSPTLRPEVIDCVFISKNLATAVGMGTNYQLRYLNYIVPYVESLKMMGAKTYTLPRYGEAVVLAPGSASK